MKHQNPNGTWIEFEEHALYLGDCKSEIICWVEAEWLEDPSVVLIVANAVRILCVKGGPALRKLLGK